jgi:hypothetical protein
VKVKGEMNILLLPHPPHVSSELICLWESCISSPHHVPPLCFLSPPDHVHSHIKDFASMSTWISPFKNNISQLALVVHSCNPSYLSGWDQDDHSSMPVQEKAHKTPSQLIARYCSMCLSTQLWSRLRWGRSQF